MKRIIKRIFPLFLAAVIIMSIGWYLFEYDPAFTRDVILRSARMLEDNGNHSAAVWLYNLAYEHSDGKDSVAIELAQQFKDIGNYSKAEYTLRNAIQDGGSVELYAALCKTYVEQGKLRDAVLLLDNANPAIKSQLDKLRPATPTASLEPGTYNQFFTVEICGEGTLYVSTDVDYPSSLTDAYSRPITLGDGETTIFAVSVGQNGLVSPLVVFTYVVDDVVEAVTFQDPVWEQAVRSYLGMAPDQAIYSNTLRQITKLELYDDVTSCADLKWFTSLESLVIDGTTLDQPDAFLALQSLKVLTISDTNVSTELLSAIGTLTSLQELSLTNCGIASVSSLVRLTNLTKLDLQGNAIRDISGLRGMTSLEYLNLSNNALIALDELGDLVNLSHLDVSYNSVISVAPLSNLTALTYLNIDSNKLRTIGGLETLTNLTQFYAAYNTLIDVNALENCSKLTHLNVSHNTLLDIDVTASLTALEELYFAYNDVTKLPKFNKNCALRIISGEYNYLGSLKNLSGLKNLTHIYMDYNADISTVDSLVNCPKLEEVYVYGTNVRSVSKLTEKDILVIYTPVN